MFKQWARYAAKILPIKGDVIRVVLEDDTERRNGKGGKIKPKEHQKVRIPRRIRKRGKVLATVMATDKVSLPHAR